MGFDINISLVLGMCEETGKPFYYKYNKYTGVQKSYEIPNVEVPKELRPYLVGRGHIFHAYTKTFNERDVYETSVEQFLENFPSWDDVQAHENYEEGECGWTEYDHENFKKLVEWCSVQDCSFRISWSY